MKKLRFVLFFIFALYASASAAADLSFLQPCIAGSKGPYIVYIDKLHKKLYLVSRNLTAVRCYDVSTGFGIGRKLYGSDGCTPSGIYSITRIYQEREPWTLKMAEDKLYAADRETGEYQAYKCYCASLRKEYESGRDSLRAMNEAYLRAEQGHERFGTGADLGKNSYGSVFMRLDYPNADDIKKYKKARSLGLIPANLDGTIPGLGAGIAIHGTCDPASIGYDASQGCVRMKNMDIIELSWYVQKGTAVYIK